MGQKSRSKRQQQKKQPARAVDQPATVTPLAAAQPSLIRSSATYRPQAPTKAIAFEDLLQVRKGDIRKIGFLMLLMLLILAALTIVNSQTSLLVTAGERLSRFARL
jgi:hypothetical protein